MRRQEVKLGFWPFVFTTLLPAVFTADTLIKSFCAPDVSYTQMPGKLAQIGFDTQIAAALEKSNKELEELHQQELDLAKKQEAIEKSIMSREKMKEFLGKYGMFLVLGGVAVGTYLISKRGT